ncbi:MAG TPA: ATP-binding protein [Polyangiales bacterium]|nr:ATP-binding protein [Polyangiales bacterium]
MAQVQSEKLEESQPQLAGAATPEMLLELMSEAVIVVDGRARICFANPSAQRIFGYATSELRGNALDVILPASAEADGLRFEASVGAQLALRVGTLELARARRKSGEEFLVEMSVSAALPGQAGTLLIIRERSNSTTVSRPAPTHFEGASVGIVQLNERGDITYINDAWRSFIEENAAYESTCVGLGASYLDACDKSKHGWAQKAAQGIRSLLAEESDFFELLYDCHSPVQLRWMHLQAQRPPGHNTGVVLTHIDYTSQQLANARSRIQTCVTNCFASHISLLASCRELALIICTELEWDFMAIWVPDPSTWELRCADVWTRPSLHLQELEQTKLRMRWGPNQGLPGRVWSSRQSEWIAVEPHQEEEHRLPDPLRQAGFCSGFAFSVKYDDDVLAVLEVSGRMCQWPDYSLLAWLEVAGVQLATAELRQRAEHRAAAAEAEAVESREQLEAVLTCVPALVLATDRLGEVKFVNRDYAHTFVGSTWRKHFPTASHPAIEQALQIVLDGGPSQTKDVTVTHPDGRMTWSTLYLGPIGSNLQITGVLIVAQDVSDTKRAQQELFSAQHMAALGTMAAGVAHEINTPIQFVGDSIDFLRSANQDSYALLSALLQLRAALADQGAPGALQPLIAKTHELEEQADLEYLVENVPKAFDRAVDGLERVTTIVRSMKEFTHQGGTNMSPVDLNRAIAATLTVARNEYKYIADLITEFGDLPSVNCHVSEINQVVLNIVVNAAHAINDVVASTEKRGTITVSTYTQGENAVITVEDTGRGIPEHVRDRIFDPFFTTKEVGKGTGLGLALAWQIIKEKHGGELAFETKLGVGTKFFIRIPIAGQSSDEVAAS